MMATKRIVLDGCVFVLGMLALACGDGTTATSPATQDLQASRSSANAVALNLTGRIVYVNKGLHVYNLATSTDVNLRISGVNPDFSPDGALITYQQPTGSGKGIRVMNSNGTGGRVLSTSGANPSFDPTGTWVAFTDNGVWKVKVDGTGLQRLTTDAAHWPAWSPDGTQIAYGAPVGSVEQLFIVNADGTNRHQALTTSGSVIDVAWRPSSRLVFGMASPNYELYSYDPAVPSSLTRLMASGFEPSWSPDATQISWAGSGGIWIMNADGSGQQGPIIAKGRQGSWGR